MPDLKEFARKHLTWLGHDSFLIHAGKTIYIDPYQITDAKPADIVLITHEHFDHCSPEDIAKIQHDKTVVVAPEDCLGKLTGNVRSIKPGMKIEIHGIEIEAVPAYNVGKKFHPRLNAWVGYILTLEGIRLYHAGDTDFVPEMKTLRTDIAMLPVSGTYVMTAEEAVQAALAMRPKLAIP
ncbi:MAG TPA: MBL fold metallo-hydrolase, partial [Candidatus Ozemobacteraceae bacterium]|nr:MBL fold metallo-hydrolase [Candidatus Ozemobacteraceae bacterium]